MGAEHWDAQVGSVADEAARLLESLRRSAATGTQDADDSEDAWDARDARGARRAEGAGAAGADGGAPASGRSTGPGEEPPPGQAGAEPGPCSCGTAEPDAVCQWCPICRGAAVVRSLSPQTLERLADLAGLAATVLADLAGARAQGGAATPGAAEGADRPPRTPRPAASRPIPVHDADDPQEAPRG